MSSVYSGTKYEYISTLYIIGSSVVIVGGFICGVLFITAGVRRQGSPLSWQGIGTAVLIIGISLFIFFLKNNVIFIVTGGMFIWCVSIFGGVIMTIFNVVLSIVMLIYGCKDSNVSGREIPTEEFKVICFYFSFFFFVLIFCFFVLFVLGVAFLFKKFHQDWMNMPAYNVYPRYPFATIHSTTNIVWNRYNSLLN
jgi:hypothetical protein